MPALLQEIIELLVSGIQQLAGGIGDGLKELVESIFITATTVEGVTTYHLSTFGGIIVCFAGISLAVGLCRWVMMFVTSLGAKN